MLSGGQIVILLSMYSTGIENHFDTKIILYHFPFQRYKKNKIYMLEFQEPENSCFKQLNVSFCKQVNGAAKQNSM